MRILAVVNRERIQNLLDLAMQAGVSKEQKNIERSEELSEILFEQLDLLFDGWEIDDDGLIESEPMPDSTVGVV